MLHAARVLPKREKLHDGSTDDEKDTPSLLYTILPSILQCRIPKLRSLRQTASSYSRPTLSRSPSDVSHDSKTPPPSYHTSARASICESDDEDEPAVCYSVSQTTTSGNTTPAPVEEMESGVRWKYAMQGQMLLSLSTQEARSQSQHSRFSRKLYIDSLEYLLEGLPSGLTTEEAISLRAALPASLATIPSAETHIVVHSEPGCEQRTKPLSAAEPSMLHRAAADVTLYTFLAVSLLLPYLQAFMQQAYRYDRKHKISDRLFAQGVLTADMLTKRTLLLANNICTMQEGKVGEALKGAGMWWIQGVSGGVHEGVGEGMQALGLMGAANSKHDCRL